MNLQPFIDKVKWVVDSHKISDGAYCRYLWQNEKGTRRLGVNAYGCADAANILYTIGAFPREPAERAEWISTLQGFQDPETGLFQDGSHHIYHTTAACAAALELFDARPLYPLTGLHQYLEPRNLHALLSGLRWEDSPWGDAHQGAGVYAALSITGEGGLAWQRDYFDWLASRADPDCGLGLKGRKGTAPMTHQLYGWFHYMFNFICARRPLPYPDKVIDSCIELYKSGALTDAFCHEIGYLEIDLAYALNRALRECGHRFSECRALLTETAGKFTAYLCTVDPETDEAMNDLHSLFGCVCALSELQLALPGAIETDVPLKNVLDRRPFI